MHRPDAALEVALEELQRRGWSEEAERIVMIGADIYLDHRQPDAARELLGQAVAKAGKTAEASLTERLQALGG